jgi:hypothetical protein
MLAPFFWFRGLLGAARDLQSRALIIEFLIHLIFCIAPLGLATTLLLLIPRASPGVINVTLLWSSKILPED